jgi:DNA polymerase III sliding clamp (beta) subunit (PCNA family)
MTEANTVRMTPSEARAALDMALTCVDAGKKGRDVLTGVVLRTREHRAIFGASDGIQAIRVTVSRRQNLELADEVLIPSAVVREALKMLAPHAKGPQVANVEIKAGRIAVLHRDSLEVIASQSFTPITGSYPNYEQLIPATRERGDGEFSPAHIQGSFLANAGKLAAKYSARGGVRFQPANTPRQVIRLDWSTDDWSAVMLLMPLFIAGVE